MIRATCPDDWQLLRDVRLRALAEAPHAFVTTLAEASALPDEDWRERAAPSAGNATFVAEGEGRFEGMVSAFVADDPSLAFLVAMWVDPSVRGTGVAAQLVERVVEWARARGAERVRLAVEPRNERAARLYERCGFARMAEAPAFPWRDHDSIAYERRP